MTFVEYHLCECLRASCLETNGFKVEAAKLRAQAKLRIMVMDDAEIAELATFTAKRRGLSVEEAIDELCGRVEELHHTAGEWVPDLHLDPAFLIRRN